MNVWQLTLNDAKTLKVLKNIDHETESFGLLSMCVLRNIDGSINI